jgi:hypothetical protein
MLEDTIFWLAFTGLIAGMGVGISLLEDEGDPFLRGVMFTSAIMLAMFIYLTALAEKIPFAPFLLGFSFLIGGIAVMAVAFAAGGNLRTAFLAGGLAGVTLQVMMKILPHGSFGFTGFHDFADVIDFAATALVGAGVYYFLRNWGKEGNT